MRVPAPTRPLAEPPSARCPVIPCPCQPPTGLQNAPGAHQSGIPIGCPPHRLCLTSGRTDRGTAALHGDGHRVQVILCVAFCTSTPVLRFTIRHLAERVKTRDQTADRDEARSASGRMDSRKLRSARPLGCLSARLASRWAVGNPGLPCPSARAGRRPARPRRDSLRYVAGTQGQPTPGRRAHGCGVAPLKAAPPCRANLR